MTYVQPTVIRHPVDEAGKLIDLQRQQRNSGNGLARHMTEVQASCPSLADRRITLTPDPSLVKPTPRPTDSAPVPPTPKFPKPL